MKWWRLFRKPFDRCRYGNHVIWTKCGITLCRKHADDLELGHAPNGTNQKERIVPSQNASNVPVVTYVDGERCIVGMVVATRATITGSLLTDLPDNVETAFQNGIEEVRVVTKPSPTGKGPRCLAPMAGDKVCNRLEGHTSGHDPR